MEDESEKSGNRYNVENEKVSTETMNPCDIIEFSIWKNKKISITKALIPLRIAQILWDGGFRIIAIFYFVILTQRGFTLLEVSSLYSITFLFQIAIAVISGIIADRIGYAKPVLLFHILGTLSTLLCFQFVPELRDRSCTEQAMDITCYNFTDNFRNKSFCDICNEINTENLNSIKPDENLLANPNHSDILKDFNSTINYRRTSESYPEAFNMSITDTLCFQNCPTLCKDFQTSKSICLAKEKILFPIYYILNLCLFSFAGAGNRFFDFIAISLANKYGSNFGKESFIAAFGNILVVAVAAFGLNIETSIDNYTNYDLAYWCCIVAIVLTFISVYNIENVKFIPGRKLKEKAWKLFTNIDTLIFIIVVFVLGNGLNFNGNFNLWFIENLKASKIVIGLHSLTNSFYGILILLSSQWWITTFGTDKIIVLALLSHVINEVGYSFLYNPWFSLLLEMTIMFSFHLLWVAVVSHSKEIAPEGFAATLNAVTGAVHFIIGRSTSVPVGALLINYFEARVAYRVFASILLITAVFYSSYLYWRHLMVRGKPTKNGDEVEEMKHMNQTKEQEA